MCFALIYAQGQMQGLSFQLPDFTKILKLVQAIVEALGSQQ